MSDLLSPLRRAERVLGNRLIVLERQLPSDYANHPLWAEYLQVVHELRAVHAALARPQPLPDVVPDLPRRPPRRIP